MGTYVHYTVRSEEPLFGHLHSKVQSYFKTYVLKVSTKNGPLVHIIYGNVLYRSHSAGFTLLQICSFHFAIRTWYEHYTADNILAITLNLQPCHMYVI